MRFITLASLVVAACGFVSAVPTSDTQLITNSEGATNADVEVTICPRFNFEAPCFTSLVHTGQCQPFGVQNVAIRSFYASGGRFCVLFRDFNCAGAPTTLRPPTSGNVDFLARSFRCNV